MPKDVLCLRSHCGRAGELSQRLAKQRLMLVHPSNCDEPEMTSNHDKPEVT
jgi:hypothetical protein